MVLYGCTFTFHLQQIYLNIQHIFQILSLLHINFQAIKAVVD